MSSVINVQVIIIYMQLCLAGYLLIVSQSLDPLPSATVPQNYSWAQLLRKRLWLLVAFESGCETITKLETVGHR